jgi:hypothetical protein
VLQTGSDALPLSVRDAVRARTRTLSTPARDALEVAALVGSRMQAELLLSLVNDPVIMDELISQDLLIKDGNDLRFRHEIARVAIEAAVPPYRTAAFHSSLFISVEPSNITCPRFSANSAPPPAKALPTRRSNWI